VGTTVGGGVGVTVGTIVGATVAATLGTAVGFGTAVGAGFAGTLVAVGLDSGFCVGVALGAAVFSGAGVAVAGGFAVGAATCCVAVGAETASLLSLSLSSDPEEQPITRAEARISNADPGIKIFLKPIFISVFTSQKF
tara:strand:- start:630 stop:1043 length:414 start_codon:yes stop_codon:yes gene_type:complete